MQDNPHVFKLIALCVMEDCSPMLSKILHTGETYFFCNDYEDNGRGGICLKQNVQELAPNFFQVKGGPLVSISAVVGMNGDGKSSMPVSALTTTVSVSFPVSTLSCSTK